MARNSKVDLNSDVIITDHTPRNHQYPNQNQPVLDNLNVPLQQFMHQQYIP